MVSTDECRRARRAGTRRERHSSAALSSRAENEERIGEGWTEYARSVPGKHLPSGRQKNES